MGYLPTSVTENTTETDDEKYKDFYFDETCGKLTGQVVEGVSALKSWIYFALKIARYRYPIYSWKYGSELENLIGTTYEDEDLMQSETKRYIEDALLINPYIKSVDDVEVTKEEEKIHITCNVSTKYGDLYVKI